MLLHSNATVCGQICAMEKVITLRAKVYITLQTSPYTLSVLFQLRIVLPVRLWNIIHVLIVAVLAIIVLPCLDRVMPHSIEALAEFPSLQRHRCHVLLSSPAPIVARSSVVLTLVVIDVVVFVVIFLDVVDIIIGRCHRRCRRRSHSHHRRRRRHYHRHRAVAAKTTAGRPPRPLRE